MSHEFTVTDGTKVTLPLPHLSNSQVEMYLRCPRQYYHRYIEGLKEPPGFSLAQGLAGHGALERNNLNKIATGEDLPTGTVLEAMNDDWSDRFKEAAGEMVIVCPEKKKLRKVTDKDVDLSRKDLSDRLFAYMEEDAPSITPVGAEEEWKVDVAGIPLLAYTDLRTGNAVWDYKFGNSRRTSYAQRGAADKSLQLTLYSKLTGNDRVGYYVFLPEEKLKTKTNPAEVRKVGAKRDDNQRLYAEYVVQEVAKAISAGAFPLCAEDNFLCQPNYCGFWHRCKGRLAEGKFPIMGPPRVREEELPEQTPEEAEATQKVKLPPKPKRKKTDA